MKFVEVLHLLVLLVASIGLVEGYEVTEEEALELLQEFRPTAHEIVTESFMKQDQYLLRWLKAHEYNLENTKNALKYAMAWRQENDLENILSQEFPPSVHTEYPYVLDGAVDREGRPVLHVQAGHFNLRKTTIGRQEHVLIRFVTLMFEMVERYIYYARIVEKKGNKTSSILISDLQGYNLVSTGCLNCLGIIPDMVPILESYYPGMFHRIYFINTPAFFTTMLTIIKSLMRAETKESLMIYNTDVPKWQAALLEAIPSDQLPIKYGGSRPRSKTTLQKRLQGYIEMEREGKLPVAVAEPEMEEADGNAITESTTTPEPPNHAPHHHYAPPPAHHEHKVEHQADDGHVHRELPKPNSGVGSEKDHTDAHVDDFDFDFGFDFEPFESERANLTEPTPTTSTSTEPPKPSTTTTRKLSFKNWRHHNHTHPHNHTHKPQYKDVRIKPKLDTAGGVRSSLSLDSFSYSAIVVLAIVSKMLCY